jgi:hypothetical protein
MSVPVVSAAINTMLYMTNLLKKRNGKGTSCCQQARLGEDGQNECHQMGNRMAQAHPETPSFAHYNQAISAGKRICVIWVG